MTIDAWITKGAAQHPNKCAIEFGDTRLSYHDLAQAIDEQVASFQSQGITHGDRVAWYGLNHPKVFVLLFACARIGAIFVPLNWRLAPAEVAAIAKNCAPRLIYADDTFAKAATALPLAPQAPARDKVATASDPLLIVYTSGSTGHPKGVVLSQAALVANAQMSVQAHGLTAADRVLNVLPLFHVGGLNILPTPAFSVGATVVLHPGFDATAMLADLQTVQAAITVPTVLTTLLAHPDWQGCNLQGLRCMSIGSTDVPRELIDQVQARGIPLLQIYGATETAPFAIYQTHLDALETPGSIGRKGLCDIRLVKADGQDAGPNQPGEIWVKGANTLSHYWNAPDLTAQSIEDGWFKTGDVATCNAAGQYAFTDRIKHIIISGGENIYPAEVERILRQHPQVTEVAVVGLPDPKWGETPVAVVVAQGSLSAAALLATLDGKLARYKCPKRVVFVPALPRNAMGKVVADQVRALVPPA